jgi:hypothetical protein
MPATLAQLQARLDALKAAVANGVTMVEHKGPARSSILRFESYQAALSSL